MNTIVSIKPLLVTLISLAVMPALVLSRRPNIREGWTFAAALIKFGLVVSMIPDVLGGSVITFTLARVLPGVAIAFRVDAFGLLFALVASFLWIVTSAYSIGYMRGLDEHAQTRYYSFFALSLSATLGVAFSANLLTLYLYYEMLSFATYPLVTHHQDAEGRSSGRKYLVYIVGGSIGLVLPAMIATYLIAGTLDFTDGGILPKLVSPPAAFLLAALFLFGFAKAGVMPMHSWLPAAMVAPTPVSALLHAVAVVKVGAFCIFRIFTGVFGVHTLSSLHLNPFICAAASVTILMSSFIALSQDGLKRRLAFSTIGQLSYIVLAAALLSKTGVMGGMLHIAMHAFGKITLFFCAGAIFVATGIQNISDMTGIGRRMPITMTAFFIGALSVIGLPPCGGFISKWHLVLGTVEAHQYVLLAVLLISSLLNAAYFLPIVYKAFFCTDDESAFERNQVQEAPPWCVAPLVVTAAGSIGLFFFPDLVMRLAQSAASAMWGGSP